MPEHLGVDRKGEAGGAPMRLTRVVDRIGRERADALGGEHKRAVGGLQAQLAEADISERSLLVAADELGVRCRRGTWWLPG
jgi:hypothetical protein